MISTLREAYAEWGPLGMVEKFKDQEFRRIAAQGVAGLSAVAVVAVALPQIEQRAETQTDNAMWRITARAFIEAGDPQTPDEAGIPRRFAALIADRAENSARSDRDAWAPFQTFTPVHFENATRQSRDHNCLSRAIYYEARNEASLGQLAVAEVVLNRVSHRLYPNNICGVVYEGTDRATGLSVFGTNQSCQFSFTCDGSEARRTPRGAAWAKAQSVAAHAMMDLSRSVTDDATHYHANYVDPFWAPRLVHTRTIGTHVFYRFPTSQEARGRRGA